MALPPLCISAGDDTIKYLSYMTHQRAAALPARRANGGCE